MLPGSLLIGFAALKMDDYTFAAKLEVFNTCPDCLRASECARKRKEKNRFVPDRTKVIAASMCNLDSKDREYTQVLTNHYSLCTKQCDNFGY